MAQGAMQWNAMFIALVPLLEVAALGLRKPKFSGNLAKSGDYMPATETGRVYHSVVKILYTVDCDNRLHEAKKDQKLEAPPEALSTYCADHYEGGSLSKCEGFITELEAEFKKDDEEFDVNSFCENMWNLNAEYSDEQAQEKLDKLNEEREANRIEFSTPEPIVVSYMIVDDGEPCAGGYVTTEDECAKAAGELGLSDTTVMAYPGEGAEGDRPAAMCSYAPDLVADNLQFFPDGTGACGVNGTIARKGLQKENVHFQCICREP